MEFEKSKGNYLALMQIIEEYRNDEAAPSKGLLYFLQGVVPELAITKYGKRPGMEDLKEFFCNKVLQLNSGSRSFCEYENYFMHGNADGYVYTPEFMNACMEEKELIEHGNPKLLLQRLWEVAHERLYVYFRCASEDEFTEVTETVEIEQKKREYYSQFIKAVSLYEVFVMKYLGDASFGRASEQLEEFGYCMDRLRPLTEKFYGAGGNLPEEEAEEVLQELEEVFEKIKVLQEGIREAERATAYLRHIKYLAAFSVIVLLVEYKNVTEYSFSKKLERKRETEILKSILEKEYNYIYINNVKMNKGRVYTERYKDFLEIAEQNRILQELCSSSTKLQNSALEQIKEYFYRVKSGTYKDKSGQEEKDFSQIVMQIAVKCVQIRKFKEETIECIM